ncbi:hypothetical protein FRB90_011597 [Tulasnella sp. 427]|nr:hypothetical protein FRB90_011597 [Tulasnella sp. 427]
MVHAFKSQIENLSVTDWLGFFAFPLIVAYVAWTTAAFYRPNVIPVNTERVLVVGASSGVGRAIALKYAKRGAKVAVMGRRKELLDRVRQECLEAGSPKALAAVGDFTSVDAVLNARKLVEKEFDGLDTLVVAAGVSAHKALITDVAKTPREADGSFASGKPIKSNIQKANDVATAAINGNYLGPLNTAVTFIPLLESSSPCPAVLLIASAASVIPAPTRSLYCASKGASLLLFQSLAMEHPKIKFSHVLPGTIQGDFRKAACDGAGPTETSDKALKVDSVADTSIDAIDRAVKTTFMPWHYRWAHLLYWLAPSVVESGAQRKYKWRSS